MPENEPAYNFSRLKISTPKPSESANDQQIISRSLEKIEITYKEKRDLFRFLCAGQKHVQAEVFMKLLHSTQTRLFSNADVTMTEVLEFLMLVSSTGDGLIDLDGFDLACDSNIYMSRLTKRLASERRLRAQHAQYAKHTVLALDRMDLKQNLFWAWDDRALHTADVSEGLSKEEEETINSLWNSLASSSIQDYEQAQEKQMWETMEVLDSQGEGEELEFLVKWTDQPEGPDNPSWEAAAIFADDAAPALQQFYEKQREIEQRGSVEFDWNEEAEERHSDVLMEEEMEKEWALEMQRELGEINTPQQSSIKNSPTKMHHLDKLSIELHGKEPSLPLSLSSSLSRDSTSSYETGQWKVVHKSRLRVRDRPSIEGAVVDSLETGAVVFAEDFLGYWLKHSLGWSMMKQGTHVLMERITDKLEKTPRTVKTPPPLPPKLSGQ